MLFKPTENVTNVIQNKSKKNVEYAIQSNSGKQSQKWARNMAWKKIELVVSIATLKSNQSR